MRRITSPCFVILPRRSVAACVLWRREKAWLSLSLSSLTPMALLWMSSGVQLALFAR
jgi:hypothetical protein